MRRHEKMQEETIVQAAQEGDVVTSPANEPPSEVSVLQAELDLVKGERDQLLDRLARLQAEFDNARKRESKERLDAQDRAVSRAVEPFLGVMDNFQLALKSDGNVEQLRAGVELILKQ